MKIFSMLDLTLNFDLDISKVISEIWHGRHENWTRSFREIATSVTNDQPINKLAFSECFTTTIITTDLIGITDKQRLKIL